MVSGAQHTIRFHVDDLLSSHHDSKVNDQFDAWTQRQYSKLKLVTIKCGRKHEFLGMLLDFSVDGYCHVIQDKYIDDIVLDWPEKFKDEDKVLIPASSSLFEKGGGGLLCLNKVKIFHSIVAKGLLISKCSRPDITPTISVLSGRVRIPNKND